MTRDLMDDLQDLDTAPAQPWWRRRTLGVVAVLGLVGALATVAVVGVGDGDVAAGASPRTVEATVRDLTGLGSATGTVQRRTALTVVAGRTAPGEASTTEGSATAAGAAAPSASGSDAATGAPSDVASGAGAAAAVRAGGPYPAVTAQLVAYRSTDAAASPSPSSPSPSPAPSPTASPTPTASPSPTPTAAPTPTSRPSPTPQPSPAPQPPPTPQPLPTAPRTSPTATPPGGATPTAPSGQGAAPTRSGPTGAEPAPLLTGLADVGTTLDDGTVAYRVDGEAVVVMVDDTPSYRDLSVGDQGPDVLALEKLLRRLGRADGVTVDDEYTSATASAVRRWERSLRRADPDGTVTRGDLLVVAEEWQVTGTRADVGDEAPDGTPLLTLGSGQSEVVVDVEVDDLDSWRPGTASSVTIGAEQVDGVVQSVGRNAVDDQVEVRIAVGRSPALPGTPAAATVTVAHRSRVLAVPVSAVVAGPDGSAVVRRVTGTGSATTTADVPVTLGTTVEGWVEVTGVRAGDRVVVP